MQGASSCEHVRVASGSVNRRGNPWLTEPLSAFTNSSALWRQINVAEQFTAQRTASRRACAERPSGDVAEGSSKLHCVESACRNYAACRYTS